MAASKAGAIYRGVDAELNYYVSSTECNPQLQQSLRLFLFRLCPSQF